MRRSSRRATDTDARNQSLDKLLDLAVNGSPDAQEAAAVRAAAPDRIYHLAAQSYPSASWDAPITTMRTNVEGTINLLEAVRAHAPAARVHIAGSSAEYGVVSPESVPIGETHPLRPASPYGVSKVAQELLGLQYHDSYGAPVTQTTNCTASIAWTTPSDGVTGTDKRDPVSGLIWSQALLNSGGTVTFTTGGPSTWSWDATAANNVAVGTKTAKQLCSDRGNGWRLPTQKELMQAYVDGSYFNLSQPSTSFWSATHYSSTSAWAVYLNIGLTYYVSMGNTYNVRCVR